MLAKEFGVRRGSPSDSGERDPRVQLGLALERLYASLNDLHRGDPLSLRHVWSHAGDVTLATPSDGVLRTWDGVRTLLDRQARDRQGWEVVAEDVAIALCADAAWAVCAERSIRTGADGHAVEVRHQSTNVFRRESGAWRLVHRQVAPAAYDGRGDAATAASRAGSTPPS
jgi:hypothetical protein